MFFCSSVEVLALKEMTGSSSSVFENIFFDNRTQLLVTGPVRVPAAVIGTGTQDKVDDFVAEIFRVADTRRLLDFLQFSVQ